jgi:two-component system, NarL family, sensor kinase
LPGRWEELNRRVTDRLQDRSIKAIFVWSAAGQVVYCSDTRLIGSMPPPSVELGQALHGSVVSEVDSNPEEEFTGRGEEPLLEVYAPMTIDGQPMAIEAYMSAESLQKQAGALRWQILPLAVGALLLLQFVQTPLTVSLVRRVQRQQAEHADLLARSLTASERERRAIAADVHDGPVQELAGMSYALDALRTTVPAVSHGAIDRLTMTAREAVWSLRRLIIDLYPPDLTPPALASALEDLADQARLKGVDVDLQVEPALDLPTDLAAVIYRTMKEALANVLKHAHATQVWATVESVGTAESAAILLRILDDGVGFPEGALERPVDGHLGLRLMFDRVTEAGGTLIVGARPEGGACVSALLPVDRAH